MKEDALELMVDDKEDDKIIERKLRKGFITKVYGIIFFQLLITTIAVYISLVNEAIMKFMMQNNYVIFFSAISAIIVLLIMVCGKLTNVVPINYILLLIFTLFESITVAFITVYYEPISVLSCAGLTMLIVFGLTMYACFTKTDFTMMGGFLFSCSIVLIFLGIIGLFFRSYFYQMLLNSMRVLLMSVYLIFDTQLVIGKNSQLIKLDDYILASLNIYLDVINIFLKILRLFGKKK